MSTRMNGHVLGDGSTEGGAVGRRQGRCGCADDDGRRGNETAVSAPMIDGVQQVLVEVIENDIWVPRGPVISTTTET